MNTNVLIAHGIYFNKGLSRFLGDSKLYETLLSSFLEDDTLERAKACFDSRDFAKLFNVVHEIKGVSGNLEMDDLYVATSKLVEELRPKVYIYDRIKPLYDNFVYEYNRVVEGIKEAQK